MRDIPEITTHELVSSYYDGLKEAVDFVQSRIIGVLSGQLNLSKQEQSVLGIFFRIHALACSLIRLNQKIDFNAVAIIARTIFELLLDIKMLSSPTVKQRDLERFISFPDVDRFRKAHKIVSLQKQYPYLEDRSLLDSSKRKEFVEEPGKCDTIKAKVEELWGKNKKGKLNWPDNWSGSSIREQAKYFGPLYEQEYLEIYSLLSSYTHGGGSAYFGFSVKTFESVYGNSLEYARKMYIEAVIICSEMFNLKKGIVNFIQIIDFLKNAPKDILIAHGLKKLGEGLEEDKELGID